MFYRFACLLLLALIAFPVFSQNTPFGAVPSPQQRAWHDMEYYAFIHFGVNTFTDLEWGKGAENPRIFNPSSLDCRQWARIAKAAGMRGIVLTAKHHDGFCLWPSAYTEHDVASSSWKNGRGDLVRELADACREYGLKMGVYISPWDRNNPIYGKDDAAYNTYFKNQLRELLGNYGPIFEVWFDGANGDKNDPEKYQEYDWKGFRQVVNELQPNAVIFGAGYADVRWVGNERGYAPETNWGTFDSARRNPNADAEIPLLQHGVKGGDLYWPAETDVSIRPGWFYHPEEDQRVKSADHLEAIYYQSVGHNTNLILNIPIDRRGLVHPADSTAMLQLKSRLDQTFTRALAKDAKINWPDTRTAIIELPDSRTFNVLTIQEKIESGQRVEAWEVDAWVNNTWKTIGTATTIGHRRWLNVPATHTHKLRIRFTAALADPIIASIGLYFRPHQNYLLESKPDKEQRMTWWKDDAFGMFIHWGAYAVPAGRYQNKTVNGAAEWIMYTAKIPIPDYEPFARQFNPTSFDAKKWVALAKNAGMRYIVITSKHHDGFCLWDSKVSTYDVMDFAPFKRDILRELKDACDEAGIKLGFYYSIMDWHHPDAKGERFPIYRDNYMLPQLRELITNYDPAVLWFDGEWIDEWNEPQGKDLYQFVRSLKPDIIINNRVGKGRQGMQGINSSPDDVGDFGTPEQEVLAEGKASLDWESCMTMNESWGYKMDDHQWKSPEQLIANLVDISAKGGNYLLNVGPDARGIIPEESATRLLEMGKWLQTNGDFIYETSMWDIPRENEQIAYAFKPSRQTILAAIQPNPGQQQLLLRQVQPKGEIRLLGYKTPISMSWSNIQGLQIQLPKTNSSLPVVLEMSGTRAAVSNTPTFHLPGRDNLNLGIFSEPTFLEIRSQDPNATIYYTLDQTEPTSTSTRYQQPIQLTKTTHVRAIAQQPGKVASPVVKGEFRLSRFNNLRYQHLYAGQYTGGGSLGLLDGKKGSSRFSDGNWQGFEGHDFIGDVDLGKAQNPKEVRITFLQDLGAWIFSPQWVKVFGSNDGSTWTEINQVNLPIPDESSSNAAQIIPIQLTIPTATPIRYLRIHAKSQGVCPAWHAGAGGKAWLFIDEIEIN